MKNAINSVLKHKLTTALLILLGLNLLIISAEFFVPNVRDTVLGAEIFLLPMITMFVLGTSLFILLKKYEYEKSLRIFLTMSAIGSFGFFLSIFLHNASYALAIFFENAYVPMTIFNILEVIFFIIAIPICPIIFIVGYVGSIILWIKLHRRSSHSLQSE